MKAAAALLAVMGASTATLAQTPGFRTIPPPAGGTFSDAQALSQTGQYAAGGSVVGMTAPGFRWSMQGGREDFGLLPGMPSQSGATAINSDGSVLAGTAAGAPFPMSLHAYVRIGSSPLQDLGVLPSRSESIATGLSGDGATVVGTSDSGSSSGEAFRWTAATGMQGLGYLHAGDTFSKAHGISRDGSTIVGESLSASNNDGFVWTQSGGMQGLPTLPGASRPQTGAQAANADGSVVVGFGYTAAGQRHALRWAGGTAQDLGSLPGRDLTTALAVSDDGSVVGGLADSSSQGAFIWTSQTGMLSPADYLSRYGVSVPSTFQISLIQAVSGDGLTFAGWGTDLSSQLEEAFVATVPDPSAAILLLTPLLLKRRRRVR